MIVPDYWTMARFPQALQDGIGREKFILMDLHQKIEDFWPVHNILRRLI